MRIQSIESKLRMYLSDLYDLLDNGASQQDIADILYNLDDSICDKWKEIESRESGDNCD